MSPHRGIHSLVTNRRCSVLKLLNSFYVKSAVLLMIGLPVAAGLWEGVAPVILKPVYQRDAENLTSSISRGNAVASEASDALSVSGAIWWVLVGANGERIRTVGSYPAKLASTKLEGYVTLDGRRYYQSVVMLPHDRKAIIGFPFGSVLSFNEDMHSGVPLIEVWYFVASTALIIYAATKVSLTDPLVHLLLELKSTPEGAFPRVFALPKWTGLELSNLVDELSTQLGKLSSKHDKDITHARADVKDLFHREQEDRFVDKLSRLVPELTTTSAACDRILVALQNEFPQSIAFAIAANIKSSLVLSLLATENLAEDNCRALSNQSKTPLAVKLWNTVSMTLLDASDFNPLCEGWKAPDHEKVILVRLGNCRDTSLILVCGVRKDGETRITIERYMKKLSEHLSPIFHLFLRFESEFLAVRTDAITGIPNRKQFGDFVEELEAIEMQRGERNHGHMILMEGDNFAEINRTFGREQTDLLLKDLVQTIQKAIQMRPRKFALHSSDCLFRTGACQFLLYRGECTYEQAVESAELIRKAVQEKTEWSNGLSSWSLGIGIGSVGDEQRQAYMEAFKDAEIAVEYLKTQPASGQICGINSVPAKFKKNRKSSQITGDIEALKITNVLQSISTNQSNGVLTYTADSGKRFWMLVQDGVPKKAIFGNLMGNDAVLEFLSTVEDGAFQFDQVTSIDQVETGDLAQVACNVTDSIEKLLLAGTVMQGQFDGARIVINSPALYFLPLPITTSQIIWNQLAELPEPPSVREFEVMRLILSKAAHGNLNFNEIAAKLDSYPTSLVWRAGALLVQHKMVKLSRLKVTGTTL